MYCNILTGGMYVCMHVFMYYVHMCPCLPAAQLKMCTYVHLIGLKEGNTTDDGECKPLSKSDYIHLMYTTFAEFPGQPLLLI